MMIHIKDMSDEIMQLKIELEDMRKELYTIRLGLEPFAMAYHAMETGEDPTLYIKAKDLRKAAELMEDY